MDYRHEKKHEISFADLLALRAKFCAVLQKDPHAIDGKYEIRSLYFDDLYDTALKENLSGISRREKFRIRYYNGDASFIRLEKKSKLAGLGKKSRQSSRMRKRTRSRTASLRRSGCGTSRSCGSFTASCKGICCARAR